MSDFVFSIIKKKGHFSFHDYLIITMNDFSIYEIELSDLRKNHLDNCEQIINALLNNLVDKNIYNHVCSPDYGAHFYIGLVNENNIIYFVSLETYENENCHTFKFKIPIKMCDRESIILSFKKIKDLVKNSKTIIAKDITNISHGSDNL